MRIYPEGTCEFPWIGELLYCWCLSCLPMTAGGLHCLAWSVCATSRVYARLAGAFHADCRGESNLDDVAPCLEAWFRSSGLD